MHTFDKFLYEVLEPHLCHDVIGVILEKCSKYRKEVRRAEQNKPFCGTSKKAIRRRERKYHTCGKCGRHFYDHRTCDMSGSIDNFGMSYLIRYGPIALNRNYDLYNVNGYHAYHTITLQEVTRIQGLNIKSLRNYIPYPQTYRSWYYYP